MATGATRQRSDRIQIFENNKMIIKITTNYYKQNIS